MGVLKHGHRLLTIVGPDRLKLVSRNGYDRTALFREPFRALTGLLTPTSGTIRLRGKDITHVPTHRRVAAGIAMAVKNFRKLKQ